MMRNSFCIPMDPWLQSMLSEAIFDVTKNVRAHTMKKTKGGLTNSNNIMEKFGSFPHIGSDFSCAMIAHCGENRDKTVWIAEKKRWNKGNFPDLTCIHTFGQEMLLLPLPLIYRQMLDHQGSLQAWIP